MYWMIPANHKVYDHKSAFEDRGFIDWKQNLNYNVNDIVYIYRTTPFKKVMYKTVVEQVLMTSKEIINDEEYWIDKEAYTNSLKNNYARLKLVKQGDSDELILDKLIEQGLKAAPQKGCKIDKKLASYIDKYMNNYNHCNLFPNEDIPKNYYEGSVVRVIVNKYERNYKARRECIKHYGSKCMICGFDFEKVYGEIGKDFIHVHHIVPLNEIRKEYMVDYKKDLIPVCPNCHAMLHQKVDGKMYTWQELKKFLVRLDSDK